MRQHSTGIYEEVQIGRGANGTVYRIDAYQGKYVEKRINKVAVRNHHKESQLQREVAILKKIDHPNIVKYLNFKETNLHYIISMELCQGQNLKDFLFSDNYRQEIKAGNTAKIGTKIALSIINAYAEILKSMVSHRDLKLENIMIKELKNGEYQIKLIDFGESKLALDEAQTETGTHGYMAPEIYFNQTYNQSCDCFSLGILLFQIFQGICYPDQNKFLSPFGGFKPQKSQEFKNFYYQTILKNGINLTHSRTPGPFRKIIRGFLQPHPMKRYSFQKAIQILIQDKQDLRRYMRNPEQQEQQFQILQMQIIEWKFKKRSSNQCLKELKWLYQQLYQPLSKHRSQNNKKAHSKLLLQIQKRIDLNIQITPNYALNTITNKFLNQNQYLQITNKKHAIQNWFINSRIYQIQSVTFEEVTKMMEEEQIFQTQGQANKFWELVEKLLKSDERHITSVFSEYDTMDNNSANSKQLQFWLKQISNPMSSNPNLGFEWTFMTNQSSISDRLNNYASITGSDHPVEEISFGKTVNSSLDRERDKENNSMVSNGNKGQQENKSKSYVNAMVALQKKVKTLEDENGFMRKNLMKINDERNRSMSDSMATQSQLKARLKMLEPKIQRMQQLIEQNKTLRITKQQKSRKLKTMEKNFQNMQRQVNQLTLSKQQQKQACQQHKSELQASTQKIAQLQNQISQQYKKLRILQQMKQKSTVSILQKYNRSVQLMEQLQKDNVKLRKQITALKSKHTQEIGSIQDIHRGEITKLYTQIAKLNEVVGLRDMQIQEAKKQGQYFRDLYQKKDVEFMELVKNQHKIIQEERSKITKVQEKVAITLDNLSKSIEKQQNIRKNQQRNNSKSKEKKDKKKPKEQEKPSFESNEISGSKQSSYVQLPETHIPVYNRGSFQGFDSGEEEQEEFDESAIPEPIETKSVGKQIKKKRICRKQVLSSESRKADSKPNKNSAQKNIATALASPKQPKKQSKKNKEQQEQASYTIKSGPQPYPRTQFQDHLVQSLQNQQIPPPYFYSAQQYPPLPHNNHPILHIPHEQIQDFHCRSNYSIDQVMLVQLQKQLLDLYEEQEKLILGSGDQYATQAQRSQYVGRLKQINQLLRIKNQRVCDIKAKL